MIGFNHALAGGLIGKYLPWPIAVPLALASHFVLDTFPHYGIDHKQRDKSRFWKWFFTLDFFATLSLIYFPLVHHRYDMLACGLIAVIPDFVWVGRVIKTKSFNMSHNQSWYTKWHAGIQRYERSWGLVVELPLAATLFYEVIIRTWY